jgi:hypothetical protein
MSTLMTILLVEMMLAIYLAGAFIVAISVTMRHGDPTATYRLYAIRDSLIDLAVFKGVDRENPWFGVLYENVNRVLLHSNLLSGPDGWSRAALAARVDFNHSIAKPTLQPFPISSEDCPEEIRALVPELRAALEHLLRNHLGVGIQMNAQERKQRRIQRENAETLLQMMINDIRCKRAA